MIGSAYEFSKAGHHGEFRTSGERYFDHPKFVAWYLITILKICDWQSSVEALLHDLFQKSKKLNQFNGADRAYVSSMEA